ncbi:hypothetical protein WJX73_000120 [Symbiochloris irregularis]|uniref:Rubredoxin-like domain-containing protein n=1 Tax=Symbiochloris irregularis TaxID=706552 RepID=A0AAW1NMP9_9CHLO
MTSTACGISLGGPRSSTAQRTSVPVSVLRPSLARLPVLLGPTQHTGCPLQQSPLRAKRSSQQLAARALLGTGTKQYTVDVDKPIGLKLKENKNEAGGLIVTDVSGNAAKEGIERGDTVIYTSSFFGDELWPCDSINFTRTALARAPSPVAIVFVKGTNDSVNVRRLPKKPAPPKFGRALTPQQRELATHICLDCGYVYSQKKPFDEQSQDYRCPQCQAPKKRFAAYDAESGKAKGGSLLSPATIGIVVGGLVVLAALLYVGSTV